MSTHAHCHIQTGTTNTVTSAPILAARPKIDDVGRKMRIPMGFWLEEVGIL